MRFDGLGHRWIRSRDLAALAWLLHQMVRDHGSIEGFFAAGQPPGDPSIEAGLESFSTRAMALDLKAIYGRRRPTPGVGYFFSRPSSGGACKRLNLFLRWVARHDAVDLGLWDAVRPAQLVVPLDTHIIRVGRCLGVTRRASPGWGMAMDVTTALRRLESRRPGALRLLDVPPGHGRFVWLRHDALECAVPAPCGVPSGAAAGGETTDGAMSGEFRMRTKKPTRAPAPERATPEGVKNYITPGRPPPADRRARAAVEGRAPGHGRDGGVGGGQWRPLGERRLPLRQAASCARSIAASAACPRASTTRWSSTTPARRHDRVFFGATVTFRPASGDERVVTIVGVDELDTGNTRISWRSPLATSLLKAKVGDTVTLHTPRGDESLEIVDVRYDSLT